MSRSRVVPLRLPVAGRGPGTQRESLCEGPRPVAGRAPGGGEPGVRGACEWTVEWSAPTGIPQHPAQRPVSQEPGRPSCGAASALRLRGSACAGQGRAGGRYRGERRACVAAPSAAAGASRSYPHRRGVQPVPAFFLPWRSLVSAATSLSPAAGVSHGRGGRPPAARKWPVHAQPWRKSAPAHAESSAGMARPSFLRRILTARPARSRGARHFGERPVRQALHRPQGDRRRPGGRGQRPCGRPVRQG